MMRAGDSGADRARTSSLPSVGSAREPSRRRDLAVPAPASRQSGRLVPVGRRGLRRRSRARRADPAVGRLLGVPLVPRDGARVVRGPARSPTSMNDKFVNVKVDREERPDVDAVYMDAVQAMTGRGGWPMTVVIDPDGRPFWGGTYFPKENFLKVLDAIDDVWRNRRDDLAQERRGARAGDRQERRQPSPPTTCPALELVNRTLAKIAGAFDPEWGGFGSAPKFPSTHHLELVLRAFMTIGRRRRQACRHHLARRDGVGRHVRPHRRRVRPLLGRSRVARTALREDALRPGAAGARLPRRRYSVLGLPQYRQVVEETIGYVLRELRHPDGGFYSAEDADSPDEHGHGVEGLFYTWTPERGPGRARRRRRPDRSRRRTASGTASPTQGNFEGRSIPNRLEHRGQLQRTARDRTGPATTARRPLAATAAPASTTRCSPSGTRCSCYALADAGDHVPARRLERRRDRQRRVPAPRAATPPTAAGHRSWQADGRRGRATMRSPPTTRR